MSPRSSSGSWSGSGGGGAGGGRDAGGGGGARGADIIDLDRYMRGAVRPSRRSSGEDSCPRLVVDGGGLPHAAAGRPARASSGSTLAHTRHAPPHDKRFSHDSGLSDGSYKRARRPHRRSSGADAVRRSTRAPISARTNASANSLRAFRTACERALRDQQLQIARVAQLCELLTGQREQIERRAEHRTEHRTEHRAPPASVDTSEISSSSRSTQDQRRKDKHRTEECKTYKIIMNKLDELNRLFAARARSGAKAGTLPPPRAARVPSRSSGSVSVSDKLVSTEPQSRRVNKIIIPTVPTSRGVDTTEPPHLVERSVGGTSLRSDTLGSSARHARLAALQAVTHTYAVDIAPKDTPPWKRASECPNVTTESVVKCSSSGDESEASAHDPRCGFDLDNPVHLYAQAKRLQAMHATTHTGRSGGGGSALGSPFGSALGSARGSSLCAVCRSYWRSLWSCLVAQLRRVDAACS